MSLRQWIAIELQNNLKPTFEVWVSVRTIADKVINIYNVGESFVNLKKKPFPVLEEIISTK